MRKLTIASSAHTQEYLKRVLDTTSLQFGTQVLPFNAAIHNTQVNRDYDFLEQYLKVSQLPLTLLKDLLAYPKVTEDAMNLIQELHAYSIPLEALPQKTPYDKEIYKILEVVHHPFTTPVGSLKYIQEGLTHAQKTYLKNNNAQQILIDTKTPETIHFHNALNVRQEIEGVIQYIITHQITEATIVVSDINTALPYFEAAFARYDIPFMPHNRSLELAKQQCLALIQYFLEPTTPHALDIIKSNVLDIREADALMQYIQHYQLHHDALFEPFDHAPQSEVSDVSELINIQNRIQDDVLVLQQALMKFQNVTPQEGVLSLISLLNTTNAKPLLDIFQNAFPLIDSNTMPALIHRIEKTQTHYTNQTSIQFTDYNTLPLYPVEYLFALGLTSKNYPALSSHTGIFDENYRHRIVGYPTLKERNEYILNKKRSLFKCSKHLYLSYHTTNYEGKPLDVAYEIKQFVKKHGVSLVPWELYESNPFMVEDKKLHPAIAAKLYLKEGRIHGSVSSFETFVKDPYQYFIQQGLRIRKPEPLNLDARILGTLNHEYVEKTLKGEPFNGWETYLPYFSKNDAYVPYLIKRNQDIIDLHIQNLINARKSTTFKTQSLEKWINNDSLFNGIQLRGIVDRVDSNDASLLIIDYKSSDMKLSAARVREGSQLQLLTYALVLQEDLKLPVLGVFYYGLYNAILDQNIYTFKKTKGIVTPSFAHETDYQKKLRFEGWLFQELRDEFSDVQFFNALKEDKDGDIVAKKVYDLDKIRNYLIKLYDHLYHKILDGVLTSEALGLPLEQDYDFTKGNDS